MRATPVSVAVIGAGRWGALHARKLAALDGVRLVAVVDPDRARAETLAQARGAVAVPCLAHAPPVDAVTIATPLPTLAERAAEALERGCHVLVEKPLALDPQVGRRLVERARAAGRLLKVGYLERFNPALIDWRPDGILVARRIGPAAAGGLTLDWLVHDLDLAQHLLGPDLAVIGGVEAADRVSITLEGPSGRARLTAQIGAPRRHVRGRRGGRDLMAGGDALGAQMAAFVAAVRGAVDPRLADGQDAVWVLERIAALRRLAP